LLINSIVDIYITTLPLIAGGIANMIFTKTTLYKNHRYPIDGFKNYKDGKRIFGDNKTWIGFFSMIIFCIIFQVLFGILFNELSISQCNDLYIVNENTITFNFLIGCLIGFVYMISELPNSFIKRRLDIKSGKTDKGIKGVIFFMIDQIDSLIGVMFVIYLFSDFTILKYFGYVIVGGFTHIAINLILYLLKIRRNI